MIATDPSGLEWHHVIIQALFEPGRANSLPFSLAARTVFNTRTVGVIDAPGHFGFSGGHYAYNAAVRAEVNAWLAANRISPAAMTDAQARQLVQHIRNSPIPAIRNILARIATGSAGAGSAAAIVGTTSTARFAAARAGLRTFPRFSFGPFSAAIVQVLVDADSCAGAARIPAETLMRPPSSPELYELEIGTFILPTGQIYVPGSGSTYVPPAGSVVVIGRVIGNGLQAGHRLRPDQVAPYSSQDLPGGPAPRPM
jgi:hypothetical protein